MGRELRRKSPDRTLTYGAIALALVAARDELLGRDLIAYEMRFTQVLSLLPAGQLRSSEPGQGLMQLSEILRRAAVLPQANDQRRWP